MEVIRKEREVSWRAHLGTQRGSRAQVGHGEDQEHGEGDEEKETGGRADGHRCIVGESLLLGFVDLLNMYFDA
jgi:hypothetical protein